MPAKVIKRPKVEITEEWLKKVKVQADEMGQVVLHFVFKTPNSLLGDTLIRIWPTTYLYDVHSPHISDLVHIENITYYPNWHVCPAGSTTYFTLIFSGLPKSCTAFDFIEHCTNEAGAFQVKNIQRNDSDVYYLEM